MSILSSDGPIAPLTRPEEAAPVRTDEELRQRWRSIMGPGGFGCASLYLIWFDGRGRQIPLVMPFDDLEEDLDPRLASQLLSVAEIPVEGITGGSLAMALTRPGPATVTDVDRARARTLLAASRAFRLKVWPMHLATKNCVRMLTVDDLLASP